MSALRVAFDALVVAARNTVARVSGELPPGDANESIYALDRALVDVGAAEEVERIQAPAPSFIPCPNCGRCWRPQ